ncbi:hypothetical protein FUT12_19610 [Bacillus mycoides]|nr:hypothetical protein [Bacillus mycoides]MBE7149746.1 hypothetical protein [Bacillus mycoides]
MCKKRTLSKGERVLFLPRYLWAVRLPPENSTHAGKLSGRLTSRKSPIGSTNNQRNPTSD